MKKLDIDMLPGSVVRNLNNNRSCEQKRFLAGVAVFLCLSGISISTSLPAETRQPKIDAYKWHVDRKSRKLFVIRGDKVESTSVVAVGKGGITFKRNMSDQVTPTGDFVVDIILSRQPKLNFVETNLVRKYSSRKGQFANLLKTGEGLAALFANMNALDFDNDGKPDRAYGSAYIGLRSSSGAITGPKMSYFKGKPYWFSIALHGTPDDDGKIGKSASGGCVHVDAKTLDRLIRNGVVRIGTRVKIADSPPQS